MAADEGTVRVDVRIWSVRLVKTRSLATAACRAGHVRVNDERAKPASVVRAGAQVRLRYEGRERIVVARRGPPDQARTPRARAAPPPPARGGTGLSPSPPVLRRMRRVRAP